MTSPVRIALRPGYEISRIIRGGWQLAGGHGGIDAATAIADLEAACEAGITTFDCADIYTGVEELIGAFRAQYARRHGAAALALVKVHTKCVPDLDKLATLNRAGVRTIVERSLQRLRCERLDLVQFHWWDYSVPGVLDAASWLDELRREGKIELLGGTNFDTQHTAGLLAAGIPIVSTQVQYSLLDDRPEHGLAALCRRQNIHLLAYGTVAGGFLSDRWLGKPEPKPPFTNRSLTKYKLIIDDFGGWALFQELLQLLRRIAGRLGTDIASVASAYVLDRPMVAGVIVGARNRAHLPANRAIASLKLSTLDHAGIAALLERRRGPAGDAFTLERDHNGPHGSIMKYNLNTAPA